MAKRRKFGWSAIAIGSLMFASSVVGLTEPGQRYLRGPEYGKAAQAAENRGDTAAVQAAAFHDDDTEMGAGLLPFVVIASLIVLSVGTVSLRKSSPM